VTITTPTDLLVPLAHLTPSPTNPRRRISAAAIADLAETIAAFEVMHPILARPNPLATADNGEPRLEIVAGERRWRACTLLAESGRNPHRDAIPATVRALSDAQVLAMQLVENIQRADLHPLDEAEHYRRMRDDASEPATVEAIAQAGKVPVPRVYQRLSLLALVPTAREAFLEGRLHLGIALQVARLPATYQSEATRAVSNWGGEPMTNKAAAAYLREHFMTRLEHAPFDISDPTLVPAAGSCGACPKRTGVNPTLWGDLEPRDTCTDSACFATKKAAQHVRLVEQMQTSGFEVLQGDAARAVCTPDGRSLKPGMHALDGNVPHSLGNPALQVSEVLLRAQVPNSVTKVIDHPSAPVITYAVATADLEQALRKIKSHRAQLDKATAKNAAPPPAAAAPASKAVGTVPPHAPGGAPANAPAAKAAPAGPETPAATTPAAQPDQAPEQAAQPTAEAFTGPAPELLAELLAFKPPPTVAGKYAGQSLTKYQDFQVLRARGIITAAQAVHAMATDRAEGLPGHRMAHMLLVLLTWGDGYLGLHDLARLCGLEVPEDCRLTEAQSAWAWSLPDDQAERMAVAWLATQECALGTAFVQFAPAVGTGLGLDNDAIHAAAGASVADHMRLGALVNGDEGKAKSTKKAGTKKAAA